DAGQIGLPGSTMNVGHDLAERIGLAEKEMKRAVGADGRSLKTPSSDDLDLDVRTTVCAGADRVIELPEVVKEDAAGRGLVRDHREACGCARDPALLKPFQNRTGSTHGVPWSVRRRAPHHDPPWAPHALDR